MSTYRMGLHSGFFDCSAGFRQLEGRERTCSKGVFVVLLDIISAIEGEVFGEVPACVKFLYNLAIEHQMSWQPAVEVLFLTSDKLRFALFLFPGKVERW